MLSIEPTENVPQLKGIMLIFRHLLKSHLDTLLKMFHPSHWWLLKLDLSLQRVEVSEKMHANHKTLCWHMPYSKLQFDMRACTLLSCMHISC